MVKEVHKTWAGKFMAVRKDLKELRVRDFYSFLIKFNEETKPVDPNIQEMKLKEVLNNEKQINT